ncbi:MAG TPA: hypothetical protein VMV21_15450, partial [Vicinamibacteria bacterium]|nr:hypothetical protein [Vicinamibacteria bacterium]
MPTGEEASGADRRGPILDIRVRWRAGQVALGLAVLLALASLARPLAPGGPPWFKLLATLGL